MGTYDDVGFGPTDMTMSSGTPETEEPLPEDESPRPVVDLVHQVQETGVVDNGHPVYRVATYLHDPAASQAAGDRYLGDRAMAQPDLDAMIQASQARPMAPVMQRFDQWPEMGKGAFLSRDVLTLSLEADAEGWTHGDVTIGLEGLTAPACDQEQTPEAALRLAQQASGTDPSSQMRDPSWDPEVETSVVSTAQRIARESFDVESTVRRSALQSVHNTPMTSHDAIAETDAPQPSSRSSGQMGPELG